MRGRSLVLGANFETSVETAPLQSAAPSLTTPTARRHARLKELSEVLETS